MASTIAPFSPHRNSLLVFINTDNAVLSNASRHAARSHAAAVSRKRGTATKAKLRSQKDHSSATEEFCNSDEPMVCDSDDVTLSPPTRQCPGIRTPPGSLSPTTLLDISLLDPFETTALPMNQKMSGLLKGCKLWRPSHCHLLVPLLRDRSRS